MCKKLHHPIPNWTITTVINRALQLAEPLRKGENPRYILNDLQAIKFASINAPEFSPTNKTLREILQAIGGYIHGEPRLRGNEISYDMYGGNTYSTISALPYVTSMTSINIDQYATNLDSTVNNLVNLLDYAEGVIVEPYSSGYKTLRTETVNLRIEEGMRLLAQPSRLKRL